MDWQDLKGDIPERDLIAALDDNKDGLADDSAWTEVLKSADERIANAFGGDTPAKYATSANYARKIFCLEILYRRRGYARDQNPFASQAAAAEKRLSGLSSGTDRPDTTPGGAAATTEPMASRPSGGGLMA